jgi:transposase
MVMEEVTGEPAELAERVAALDIGKASLVCCVRVPHESRPGARRREVRTCDTVTPALLELRDWLICRGVTRVVMEATSAFGKQPFYLLEDDIECWVVNARDVKNVPGRPKTDKLDAVWLCKLAGRGMLRPSFIPGRAGRQLRDLTRYRRDLTEERTREKQRAEKLLGSAQLTELRERITVSGGPAGAWVVRFPARDQRWGWDRGSVVAEGAALRSG